MVPLRRMMPSWTGVTEVEAAPISTTRAEGLPQEKLGKEPRLDKRAEKDGGRKAHAESTPLLASQKAGAPQFSMAISIGFSLPLPVFQPVSVMSSGFSSRGFSCVSTPSISCLSSSVFSLSPLVRGLLALALVSLEVMAYSHRLVAVSQSSTMPFFEIGLPISMLGEGVCIAFSP